jgi:hypothetical protein
VHHQIQLIASRTIRVSQQLVDLGGVTIAPARGYRRSTPLTSSPPVVLHVAKVQGSRRASSDRPL